MDTFLITVLILVALAIIGIGIGTQTAKRIALESIAAGKIQFVGTCRGDRVLVKLKEMDGKPVYCMQHTNRNSAYLDVYDELISIRCPQYNEVLSNTEIKNHNPFTAAILETKEYGDVVLTDCTSLYKAIVFMRQFNTSR